MFGIELKYRSGKLTSPQTGDVTYLSISGGFLNITTSRQKEDLLLGSTDYLQIAIDDLPAEIGAIAKAFGGLLMAGGFPNQVDVKDRFAAIITIY